MARNRQQDEAQPADEAPDEGRRRLREAAALAALTGIVQRLGATDRGAIAHAGRIAWQYADGLLAGMDAADEVTPETPAADVDVMNIVERLQEHHWERQRLRAAERPATPSDEWAVWLGDRQTRGFVTRREAEEFAAGRPDARVVLVAGADERYVAPEYLPGEAGAPDDAGPYAAAGRGR